MPPSLPAPPLLILTCSPRCGGNSDTLAAQLAGGVRAGGGTARILALRDTPLAPCTGCDACRATGHCVLPDAATAARLYAALRAAPAVALVFPVYFYHMPAQLKAFIDRAQCFWNAGPPSPSAAARPAWLGMVAGRERGTGLFCGSERSLRCFLGLLGLRLRTSLRLRGFDAPDALARDAATLRRCRNFGLRMQKALSGQCPVDAPPCHESPRP